MTGDIKGRNIKGRGGIVMAAKTKEAFPLGEFLKTLREKKGASLRDVQEVTGISNAYLSQLETGERRKLPSPERLKKLADYYVVSIHELLEKAGYLEGGEIEETEEERIEKAFAHVTTDPRFKHGARLKGEYDLEAKRFIIEMYEKLSGKGLLNLSEKK